LCQGLDAVRAREITMSIRAGRITGAHPDGTIPGTAVDVRDPSVHRMRGCRPT